MIQCYFLVILIQRINNLQVRKEQIKSALLNPVLSNVKLVGEMYNNLLFSSSSSFSFEYLKKKKLLNYSVVVYNVFV